MSNRRNIKFGVRSFAQWLSVAVAAIVFVCGLLWQSASLLGAGAVVLCLVLRQFGNGATVQEPIANQTEPRRPRPTPGDQNSADQPPVLERLQSQASPSSTDALVDELLATGRYALLLRPETKQHLTQLHIVRAIRQLDESMALVPAGRVLLGPTCRAIAFGLRPDGRRSETRRATISSTSIRSTSIASA